MNKESELYRQIVREWWPPPCCDVLTPPPSPLNPPQHHTLLFNVSLLMMSPVFVSSLLFLLFLFIPFCLVGHLPPLPHHFNGNKICPHYLCGLLTFCASWDVSMVVCVEVLCWSRGLLSCVWYCHLLTCFFLMILNLILWSFTCFMTRFHILAFVFASFLVSIILLEVVFFYFWYNLLDTFFFLFFLSIQLPFCFILTLGTCRSSLLSRALLCFIMMWLLFDYFVTPSGLLIFQAFGLTSTLHLLYSLTLFGNSVRIVYISKWKSNRVGVWCKSMLSVVSLTEATFLLTCQTDGGNYFLTGTLVQIHLAVCVKLLKFRVLCEIIATFDKTCIFTIFSPRN